MIENYYHFFWRWSGYTFHKTAESTKPINEAVHKKQRTLKAKAVLINQLFLFQIRFYDANTIFATLLGLQKHGLDPYQSYISNKVCQW